MIFVWFLFYLLLYGALVSGSSILGIYILGKMRTFWSLIGTRKYRMVQVGEKVVDVIHDVPGYTLDKNKRFIKGERKVSIFEYLTGAQFMGFPFYSIKTYKGWTWNEFARTTGSIDKQDPKKTPENPKYASIGRETDPYEFFFQFTHSVDLEGVELGGGLGGNIRADMRVVSTIWVLAPIQLHEGNKNAISVLYARISATVRGWASDKNFDQVKKTLDAGEKLSDFSDTLQKLNGIKIEDENPDYTPKNIKDDGIFNLLGIVIVQASLEDLKAAGDAIEALEAENLANLRGRAKIAEAEQAAKALVAKARGEYEAAELQAARIRVLNEQDAGYYASLPGGSRMFVASKVASQDSDVTTWVEGKSDVDVTLPLPSAPAKPNIPPKP